jgi:hypothetical protein
MMHTTLMNAEGLQALCDAIEPLPDLCQHAEYRIYVNGQLVEVLGHVGRDAEWALKFWREASRRRLVELRVTPCATEGCTRTAL